jgi:hypothetical protein
MQTLRRSRCNTGLVIVLALALWLASTLGLMHRVVHGGAGHAAPAACGLDADCRLYDQLAGGAAALSVPLVVLPIALPMARLHYFLGEALARWVTLFDARGPPVTR